MIARPRGGQQSSAAEALYHRTRPLTCAGLSEKDFRGRVTIDEKGIVTKVRPELALYAVSEAMLVNHVKTWRLHDVFDAPSNGR